jgi:hypothetical protein
MGRVKWLYFVCCATMFAQSAGRSAISGTVVDAASGDAVRKAVVTATWHGTPRAWASVRTDGSGKFLFEGLPAGKYDLRAVKQGLGTAIYGANSVRELGDVITLGDGETRENIKLRFLRSATIVGRVVDQDGDPVVGANVHLLRPGRNLGERILNNYQAASTNDRGEYKITGVDPGEYYLRCNPLGPRQMGLAVRDAIAVPQYFGGARDSKDAAPLMVRGGDSLTGVDFHLAAERPATLTGRVTGVPQLDSPPVEPVIEGRGGLVTNGRRIRRGGGEAINISLIPADDNQVGWGNSGAGAQGPDYRFEMNETVPGRYRIEATIRAKDKSYSASQMIDVREGVNDVVLALVPAVEVKGHLTLEGPGPQRVETFTITLAKPGLGPRGGMFSAPVKKDGGFAIENVPPGEWLLNINPNQGPLFEKSVRLGDKDVLMKPIEILPASDAPLNIVLSSNTATVTGEIDAGGAEGKRAGILLEPVGKLHTFSRFYYSVTADENGKFKVNGVAPGKYRVFALEQIATGTFRNVESADLLEAGVKEMAEDLEVAEGAKVESHPKLIPEEKAREILKP